MTREQAIARAKEIERSLEYDGNGESVKCTYEIIADALMEGYEKNTTREELIDRACRWLVEHTHDAAALGNITCTSVMTEGTLIEDFRKAMAKEG